MLTLWELQESSFANVKRRNDADVLEFAEYVEVMGATGGNDRRDCFKDPANRAVLDDYLYRIAFNAKDIKFKTGLPFFLGQERGYAAREKSCSGCFQKNLLASKRRENWT